MIMASVKWAALAGTIALGACVSTQPGHENTSPATPAAQEPVTQKAQAPAAAPRATNDGAGLNVTPVTAIVPPAARTLNLAPESLIGKELERVSALYGRPDMRLREADAEIWQYREGACVLELFMYKTADILSVVHVEVRSRRPTIEAAACLGIVNELADTVGPVPEGT